ncbi:BmGPI15, Sexual stage antigen, Pfam s48/45 [Babesia microti strain RI]|uniref:BmGPI15, Sexual stage antigen, Pfam s48/45 n=1 Tax=Babesia microti (strain RI) TaxID=1133968 RepID=A0A0K3ANP2_BABMR|nr:BmGPI15, Sexual stage antigen, Pfam s48/45 [Babesia microti strain RI]CTQ41147.1 BmGPI15, Sexual stage antigen, Pfam s48/45 [Babesia microti strain RI]|eukprot:XP_021337223.1 BmGPI15, Sexual stage antigen, Pfam s48/45 [Babesia microti strain RI]
MNYIPTLTAIFVIICQYGVIAGEDPVYNEPTFITGPGYDSWSSHYGWVGKGFSENPLDLIDICTFHRVPEANLRICKINLFLGENAMIKCPSSKASHGRIHPSKPGHHYTDLSYMDGKVRIDKYYIEELPNGVTSEKLDTINNGDVLLIKYVKHNKNIEDVNFVCENDGTENDSMTDYERLSMLISISFDEYEGNCVKDILNYKIAKNLALRNNYLQWHGRNIDIEVEMLPFYNFHIYCYGILDYRLHDIPGKLVDEEFIIDRPNSNLSVFPFSRTYKEFESNNRTEKFTESSKKGTYLSENSIIAKGVEMELYLSNKLYSIVIPYEFTCNALEDDPKDYAKTHRLKLIFPSYSYMPKCTRIADSTESVPTIRTKDIVHCLADLDKYPVVVVSGESDLFIFNTSNIMESYDTGTTSIGYGNDLVTILSPSSRLVKLKSLYTANSATYNPNISLHFWNSSRDSQADISAGMITVEKENLIFLSATRKCEFNSSLYEQNNSLCTRVLKQTEALEINCDTLYPNDLTHVYIKDNDGKFLEKSISEITTGLTRFKTKHNSLLFYNQFGSFVGDRNELFLSCDPLDTSLRGSERLVRVLLGFDYIKNAKPPTVGKVRYLSALASNISTRISCPINTTGKAFSYKLLPVTTSNAFYTFPNLDSLDTSSQGPIGDTIGMTDYKISIDTQRGSNDLVITRPANHITVVDSSPQLFYVCKAEDDLSKEATTTVIELSFLSNVDSIRICGRGFNNVKLDRSDKKVTKCKYFFYPLKKSTDIPHYIIEKRNQKPKIQEYQSNAKPVSHESNHDVEKLNDNGPDVDADLGYEEETPEPLEESDKETEKTKIETTTEGNDVMGEFRAIIHKIGKLEIHLDYPSYETITNKENTVTKKPSLGSIESLDLNSFINKYNDIHKKETYNTPIGLICPIDDDGVILNPVCTAVSRGNNLFQKTRIIQNFFYMKESGYMQSLWVIDHERWKEVKKLVEDLDYTSCTCKGKDGKPTTTVEIRDDGGSGLAGMSLLLVLIAGLMV